MDDSNLRYSHLYRYLIDIRLIFSNLIHIGNSSNIPPKEWKLTDMNKNNFQDFITRDGNNGILFLHNNIFIKSKDTYVGFNHYINESTNNRYYFQLLWDHIKDFFIHINKIKGSSQSEYNDKYSNIYSAHLINVFGEWSFIKEQNSKIKVYDIFIL